MAPSLTHSVMSTRTDGMDLDSRPLEAHQAKINNYAANVDLDQLERQRMYQQQFQQQPSPSFPAYPQQHRPSHSQGQQNQLQQQPHYQQHQQSFLPQQPQPSSAYTQQQPYVQGQQPFNPPNQTEGFQATNCQLMTPSSGHSVTEMPSLAFTEGNSTATQALQESRRLAPPSPSPSMSPLAADSPDAIDSDYFLTSVLNMIAPSGIPPVALYDYHSEFTQRQRIAKGGNGEIRRAYWPLHQSSVILKCLIDTKHAPAKIAKLFDKEVEVMNQCRQHDNIVQFYGVAIRNCDDERNGERFMIMQYYEHGDLVKLLDASKPSADQPTLTDKLYLAMDIVTGLDHLFRCGFHHGDLHPKNILIDFRKNRTPLQGRYLARLTDFGLRRVRGNMNAFSSQQFGGVWQFMAPERMTKNRPRYDVRCDIYALGVIYWFIMSGRYPFKDPSTFSPGAREGMIEGTPQWYCNVYTQAWSEDPNDRQQTLEEIVHVFRYNLGIVQTPPAQYLDPDYSRSPSSSQSYGHGASGSPYIPSSGTHPHQHYTASSGGGSTIRGSPMLTPVSMLTPTSYSGRGSPNPPSSLMTNSSSASQRPTNPGHLHFMPTGVQGF
ncbi:hypothetical protein BGX28_005542 [Mortierella sp. GBA30]|nr:hypothetical protein BGX28_005542 [Mortierella sp. GBA30]